MNDRRQISLRARQTGATLIVGLVLLLMLTVLGVSGMNTATMEITMAGNTQYQEDAFQMAENGIDLALSRRPFPTGGPVPIPWLGDPNYDRRSVTNFVLLDVGRDAEEVYRALMKRGVITRPMGPYRFATSLRITVGTEAENQRLLAVLDQVLSNPGFLSP